MFDFHNHLFVVRHAATPQNIKNLCLGWTDNLPTEESLQKRVDQTCEWLKDNKINQIISSNLPRTQITAKRIATRIGVSDVASNKNFNDLNFGCYSLKDAKLISQLQPEIFDDNHLFKYNVPLKGGESLQDLENRVRQGLGEIHKTFMNSNTLLVTHGCVIAMIYKIITKQNYYNFYPKLEEESKNKLYRL